MNGESEMQVHESVQQLADSWEMIVSDRAGEVTNSAGLAVRWANSAFSFFNCITLTEPYTGGERLRLRLNDAVAYMREKDRAGLIWLFEDMLTAAAQVDLPTIAEDAGLSLSLTGYGMASNTLPSTDPGHPDLTFERVVSDDQLLDYADINSLAYGMPVTAGRDGLGGSEFWKRDVFAYLGMKDGKAVSAAATIAVDGRLFLALVATLPEMQRRGYGEATVRKALYEGARATGFTRSILHATEAGRPVYERLGFYKTSTIRFYGLEN